MPIVAIMKIEPVLIGKGLEGKRNIPLDPRLDEISVAGVFLQTKTKKLDEKVEILRAEDELWFKDGANPQGISLSGLRSPQGTADQTFRVGAGGPMLKATEPGCLQVRTADGNAFACVSGLVRLPAGNTPAGSAPLQFTDGFLNEVPQHGAVEFRNGQLTIGVNGARQPLNEGASWTGSTTAAGKQEIFLEGTKEGRLVLPDNSLFAFDIFGAGYDVVSGTAFLQIIRGAIGRETGPGSTWISIIEEEPTPEPQRTYIEVGSDVKRGALTILVTPVDATRHYWSVRARIIKILDLPPSI